MGFTHIELLPVMAHPFSGSWGYQVTGYFAPTPRHGSPDELREFVDRLHANGVGVILDWVPAHFPRDDFALARFDGTALYEHADPRRGAHPDWGTLVFNFGRHEVRNFLIASALFWLREYHVDGIRVDAVASMLYLDYSRREGEWIPNEFGGREDLDAVAFLKELNEVLYGREPGIISSAEESTAWPGVSRPTYLGGLGFGFKWNMGWMHDTLGYFQQDPIYRRYHHHELTFSLMYAFSENFILPLSHDEVVHGKGSLLNKMPGDRWQKLANLRCLYAYMWAHPGKKLLFMGGELAQEQEWSHERSLDWHLLERPEHAGIQSLVRDLNRLYRDEPALWEVDSDPSGLLVDRAQRRRPQRDRLRAAVAAAATRVVVFVANLSPVPRPGYRLGLPRSGRWREALNTDSTFYGGSDVGNLGGVEAEPIPWHGQPVSAEITLPPLAASGSCPSERPISVGAAARSAPTVPTDRPSSGSGRRAPSRSRSCWRTPRWRWRTPASGSTRRSRPAGAGDDYWFVVDGRAVPRPVLALAAGGAARPLPGARPGPLVRRRATPPGLDGLVIYELHVGTFSPEGTFEGAIPYLAELAALGVTAIEIMPVAEFPGRRGWGYDGVYLSAAQSSYGGPQGLLGARRAPPTTPGWR